MILRQRRIQYNFSGPFNFHADFTIRRTIALEEPDKIAIPVLITAGENDIIKEDHTRLIADRIKHSKLIIYKGETHESYVVNNTTLAQVIIDFVSSLAQQWLLKSAKKPE